MAMCSVHATWTNTGLVHTKIIHKHCGPLLLPYKSRRSGYHLASHSVGFGLEYRPLTYRTSRCSGYQPYFVFWGLPTYSAHSTTEIDFESYLDSGILLSCRAMTICLGI